MPLHAYSLLTAAAQGTASHPRPGTTVQMLVQLKDKNNQIVLRRRYGRKHAGVITLFPTPAEVRDILETVVLGNNSISAADVRIAAQHISSAQDTVDDTDDALANFLAVSAEDRYDLHRITVRRAFPENIDEAIDNGTILAEPIIPTRERVIDLG